MPLYEYTCRHCQQTCELLIRASESPVCPSCGRDTLVKQLSVPATPASASLSVVPPGMAGGCGRPQCGSGRCAMGE